MKIYFTELTSGYVYQQNHSIIVASLIYIFSATGSGIFLARLNNYPLNMMSLVLPWLFVFGIMIIKCVKKAYVPAIIEFMLNILPEADTFKVREQLVALWL